ncbi:MAG: 50S ribosomal protein L19 [Nitrospinales bacterium]
MNVIDQIEAREMKEKPPEVRAGDTVRVHMRIVEGEKERIQVIEGVVIRVHGGGVRKSVTVRKMSFGVGVERIFPIHSPRVEKIDIVKHAKVRQAKLYYLRDLRGKAARLKEIKVTQPKEKTTRTKKRGKAKAKAQAKAKADS